MTTAPTTRRQRPERRPPEPGEGVPHDRDLEETVIAAAFDAGEHGDADLLAAAVGFLRPEDFLDPYCRAAFEAITGAYSEHGPEAVTRSYIASTTLGPDEGFRPWLRTLDNSPNNLGATVGLSRPHLERLRELACKRQLLATAQRLAELACNGTSPAEAVAQARSDLERVAQREGGPTPWRSLADLEAEGGDGTDWAWEGYLPYGGVLLLSSRPKQGKTTLAWHMLGAALGGREEFLGLPVCLRGWALVATEEAPQRVAERCRELGIPSTAQVRVLFRKDVASWPQALSLFERAALEGMRLLVLDTWAAWVGVEDENDSAKVEQAIRPLVTLAQRHGVAIMVLHHLRKTPGDEGTAHRGSSALLGAVDVAVELKGAEGGESRRRLEALSRYSLTPRDLVIELRPDGQYVAIGSGERAAFKRAVKLAREFLPPPDGEPIGCWQLAKAIEKGGHQVSASTLKRALEWLAGQGAVETVTVPGRAAPLYRLTDRSFHHQPIKGWDGGGSFHHQAPTYKGGGGGAAPPAWAAAVLAEAGAAPPDGEDEREWLLPEEEP